MATLLLGGLFLITRIPILRPRYAVFSFVVMSLIIVSGGYLAFYVGEWLFDGSTQVLLLSPVFISLLGNTLVAADTRRRQAELQLQNTREETARVTGELDAARRIQMGLLPDPEEIFAGETRFAIAALLEPALAVGETTTTASCLTNSAYVSRSAMCPARGCPPACSWPFQRR
jgi:hypothetical protein